MATVNESNKNKLILTCGVDMPTPASSSSCHSSLASGKILGCCLPTEGIRFGDIAAPIVSPVASVGMLVVDQNASTCEVGPDNPVPPSPSSFTGGASPPIDDDATVTLQKFLPCNELPGGESTEFDGCLLSPVDAYSCDEFRMYEFKVRKCMRSRSHDWTECPFAHPGERARRRDPRRHTYSGTACPDFRKGGCRKGEACEYAHGVFECWLHPARYRTQPCKDGRNCRRRVCFFAHTPQQLRVVPPTPSPAVLDHLCGSNQSLLKAAAAAALTSGVGVYDGSPLRRALAASLDHAALELLLDDCPAQQSNHHQVGACFTAGAVSPTSTLVGHTFCASSYLGPASSSRAHSPSPPLSPAAQPLASPRTVPAHRRHLARLCSIPWLTIPASCDETPLSTPERQTPVRTREELMLSFEKELSIRGGSFPQAANRLAATILNPWAVQSQQMIHQLPRSEPMIPISRCDQQPLAPMENGVLTPLIISPRQSTTVVERGANLTRDGGVEAGPEQNCAPDLEWVNELVR